MNTHINWKTVRTVTAATLLSSIALGMVVVITVASVNAVKDRKAVERASGAERAVREVYDVDTERQDAGDTKMHRTYLAWGRNNAVHGDSRCKPRILTRGSIVGFWGDNPDYMSFEDWKLLNGNGMLR